MATRAPLANVSSAVAVDSRRQVVAGERKLWPATLNNGLAHHGDDGVDFVHGHLPGLGVFGVGVLPAARLVG